MTFDVVVVGAGIVGLATAHRLLERHPGTSVLILEKESEPAQHQTGHNSGVLHTGMYYKPGSLKAQNCRRGLSQMVEFCRQEDVPHEICGKVIVATEEQELPALEELFRRGTENGVDCERIERARLHALEPHARGVAAIHVKEAGIVDYRAVCRRLAQKVQAAGGELRTESPVVGLVARADALTVQTPLEEFSARWWINCAGLHCDRVARLGGVGDPGVRIVPFRGEYYELKESARGLCRNLIYPTPDPRFPFLGVHLTRMIGGAVECGPNAVLAFAREGYTKWQLDLRDLADALSYPGTLRLFARHARMGLGEMWRSFSKAAFVRALQRLVPDLRAEHLEPAPAGVRAQALERSGSLVHDFVLRDGPRRIDVLNAPSPAATSSLAIGDTIVDRWEHRAR